MEGTKHNEENCEYCKTGSEHQVMSPGDTFTIKCHAPREDMAAVCGQYKGHEGLHYAEIRTFEKVWWK